MTREEAIREAERLAREHRDRERFSWVPYERGGEWLVARVPAPARRGARLTPGVVAPPIPPDPGQATGPSEPRPWWGTA